MAGVRFSKTDRRIVSQVRARYAGWGRKWDEWIRVDTGKVRRLSVLPKPATAKEKELSGVEQKATTPVRVAEGEGKRTGVGGRKRRDGGNGMTQATDVQDATASISLALLRKGRKSGSKLVKGGGQCKAKSSNGGTRASKSSSIGQRKATSGASSSSTSLPVSSGVSDAAGGRTKALPAVRVRMAGYHGTLGSRYSTRPVTAAPVRLDEDTNIPDRAPNVPRERKKAASVPRPSSGVYGLGHAAPPRYQVGDQCWARDIRNEWCHAMVCACVAGKVKVHYTGWSKKWDEWKRLDADPPQVSDYVVPDDPMAEVVRTPSLKAAGGGGSRGRGRSVGRPTMSLLAGATRKRKGDCGVIARPTKNNRAGHESSPMAPVPQHPSCFDNFDQSGSIALQGDFYTQEPFDAYGSHQSCSFGDPAGSQWSNPMPPLSSEAIGGEQMGFDVPPGGEKMLASADEQKQRELLKGLQPTRDFLRTLQQARLLCDSQPRSRGATS